MKPTPLTMTSLANECLGLHDAIMQGQGRIDAAQTTQPQQLKIVEALLLGCSMTVSVIDEYAVDLHNAVYERRFENTDASAKADVYPLWKEEDMKELLSQIRGYQSRLKSLLDSLDKSVYHYLIKGNLTWRRMSDTGQTNESALGKESALINLLNRSHSSFQTRPASIRSSLRDSIISLDPSPPYALSLNGDAIDAIRRIAEDLATHFEDSGSVDGIDLPHSSLTGQNIPEDMLASTETADLHRSGELIIAATSKSSLPTVLALTASENEDDDMYDPAPTESSLVHTRKPNHLASNLAVSEDSNTLKAKVADSSNAKAISILGLATENPGEVGTALAEAGPVISYTIGVAGSEDSKIVELINWFLHDGVEQEDPSIRNNSSRVCEIDGSKVVIELAVAPSQQHYPSMRYNHLERAEGFLLVYSASSHSSFHELRQAQLVVKILTENRGLRDAPIQPTLLIARKPAWGELECVTDEVGQSFARESGYAFISVDNEYDCTFEGAIYDMVRLIRLQYREYTLPPERTTSGLLPWTRVHITTYVDPAVLNMTRAHAVLGRDQRPVAAELIRERWTRRTGSFAKNHLA
jgi:hypothetical protein